MQGEPKTTLAERDLFLASSIDHFLCLLLGLEKHRHVFVYMNIQQERAL